MISEFTPTEFKSFGDEAFTFDFVNDGFAETPKRRSLTINTQPVAFGVPAKLITPNASVDLESTFQNLINDDNFLFTPITNGVFFDEAFVDVNPSFHDLEQLLKPTEFLSHDDSTSQEDSLGTSASEDEKSTTNKVTERKKIVAKRKNTGAVTEGKKKKEQSPKDTSRIWSTVFVDDCAKNLSINVAMKTRTDKPSEYLPEKMYSSLKYEIIQKCKGSLPNNGNFLMCCAFAVDATTNEEIKKDKPVLKGVVEAALTKQPTNKEDELESKTKVQFDFSYHQDKRLIALELRYFLNDRLDNPIMIKRSCPLKVYARKPNKSKRKREEDKELKLKKLKESQEMEFAEFTGQLEKCFEMANKFADEEKKLAMFTIVKKFTDSFGSDALLMSAYNGMASTSFATSPTDCGDFFEE